MTEKRTRYQYDLEKGSLYDMDTGKVLEFIPAEKGRSVRPQRELMSAYIRKYMSTGSMWTIGTNFTIEKSEEFLEAVRKFERIVLRGKEWIAVVEVGESGFLHLHYLYPNYVPKYDSEESFGVLSVWRRCSGIAEPHVDVRKFYAKDGNIETAAISAGKYLSSYLTKSDIPGIRKFRSSKRLRHSLIKDGFLLPIKSESKYGYLVPKDVTQKVEFVGGYKYVFAKEIRPNFGA